MEFTQYTTHCDLLHLLSDDLPIFDELCRRSLMFIYKCFYSSSLVKFVTGYAIMFVRYKSTLGSNFLLCASVALPIRSLIHQEMVAQ